MPIQLTTPKSVGDLDPGAPSGQYNQAKIVAQTLKTEEKQIMITVQVGNTVDGSWRKGVMPQQTYTIMNGADHEDPEHPGDPNYIIPGVPDYDNLVSELPANTTDPIYDHAAKALYQYLIDQGLYVGTIV